MRRTGLKLVAAVAGLLAVPAAASALTAVTTEPLPLRAGPAGDFPVVDQVPADARVIVHGCLVLLSQKQRLSQYAAAAW